MAWQFIIEGDFSELDRGLAQREAIINKLETDTTKVIETTDEAAKRSYNQVVNMARGSLMVVSGITQAIGGTLGRVFSAIYTTAISVFTLYKTMAAATATFPGGQVQAAIQFAAVIMAMYNLSAVMDKQRETSRMLHGITQSLHGVSQIISNYSL